MCHTFQKQTPVCSQAVSDMPQFPGEGLSPQTKNPHLRRGLGVQTPTGTQAQMPAVLHSLRRTTLHTTHNLESVAYFRGATKHHGIECSIHLVVFTRVISQYPIFLTQLLCPKNHCDNCIISILFTMFIEKNKRCHQ